MGEAYINMWGGLSYEDAKAFEWQTKGAEQGYAPSQRALGFCYENAIGVLIADTDKAIELYTKAADQGDNIAQKYLGECYFKGNGVDKDYAKAVELYLKSAENGDAEAMCSIGLCYFQGGYGLEKDLLKAIEWYRKAAEKENIRALTLLGDCYVNATGVEKDTSKALEFYEKAAGFGNAYSMQQIGYIYYKGDGIEKNMAKVLEWWKKAAEEKDAVSAWNVYVVFVNGDGVPKDKNEAMKWLKIAADNGETNAKRVYEALSKLQKTPASLMEFGKVLQDVPSDMFEERTEYCERNKALLENIKLTRGNRADVFTAVNALDDELKKRVIADIQAAGIKVWAEFANKYTGKKLTEMNVKTFCSQNADVYCIIPKAKAFMVSDTESTLKVSLATTEQRGFDAMLASVGITLTKPNDTGKILRLLNTEPLDLNDVQADQETAIAGFVKGKSYGTIRIEGNLYEAITESNPRADR